MFQLLFDIAELSKEKNARSSLYLNKIQEFKAIKISQISTEGLTVAALSYKIVAPYKIMTTSQQQGIEKKTY